MHLWPTFYTTVLMFITSFFVLCYTHILSSPLWDMNVLLEKGQHFTTCIKLTFESWQGGCGAPLKFWLKDNKAIWCSTLAALGGLQLMCIVLCIHIIHKLKDKAGYKRASDKRRLHDEKGAYSLWAVDHHELIWWPGGCTLSFLCKYFLCKLAGLIAPVANSSYLRRDLFSIKY